MSVELGQFLKQYICTGQKDEDGKSIFTHTSIQPRAAAAYNIPMDKRAELHKLIAQSVCNRKPVFLTEKPLSVSCIKVDIDLKYPIDCSSRQHTDSHIKEFLKLYSNSIITYVDLPQDFEIDAYVFQRSGPYPSRGNMKDGIHIMYPDICVHTDIQHVIRTDALKKLDLFLDNPNIGCLPVKNSHDDVIDLSIISRTNWQMYGCCKPGVKPYELHNVYRRIDADNDTEIEFEEIPMKKRGVQVINDLIDKFSVHNVPDDAVYDCREEVKDVVEAFSEKKPSTRKKPVYSSNVNMRKHIKGLSDDDDIKCQINEAKELVELLADWRAESFKHWIEIGMCLHNISSSLQDTWVKFSKRSDKFQESDADRWVNFQQLAECGLNIGSLHRWARLDNPKKYNEVRSKMLEPLMMSSVSGVSQDVAQVIFKMYKHQYVCLDSKGRKWSEYVNHSWAITNDGMSLKKRIGRDVLNEYLLLVTRYNMAAISHEDEKKDHYLHRSKSLTEVTYKLRDIAFKEKVMKECVILFHDPKFEETLDANPFVIGMDNGVYDLKTGKFRDGRPEDRISLTTNNDYPDFDLTDIDIDEETSVIPEVQEIFNFMKQVFPKDGMRRYMWKCLASYLQGFNTDEKIHIWTGVGGNGKSKLLSLFEMAYGQYCFKLPINMLTRARGQTGQATPELAMGKTARFGSMQEPEEGAKLNSAVMKELSGNDKLYYRDLYDKGSTMKPQFSLVLLCNHKPKISSDDSGTWRRIIVIEFISEFVEGKPKGPFQFSRNTDLEQCFPLWSPWFFAMLTMFYPVYKKEGLEPSTEIAEATYDYRKDSDAYTMFIDEYFIKEAGGVIKLDQSYSVFKEWYQLEYNDKAPPRRNFKTYVERKIKQPYGHGTSKTGGWTGYTLMHPDLDDDEGHAPIQNELMEQPDNKIQISVKPKAI